MRKFIHDQYTEDEANVISFGVSIGKSCKECLDSLRVSNWFVEFFDLDNGRDLLQNVKVFDKGDVKISDYSRLTKITDEVKEILAKGKFPLMLSRCHLSSLYSLQAFDKDTKLIVFDAHCDLKNEFID